MAQVKPLPAEESKPDFCVAGIGASAGGLDALRAFFSRMPAAPGFACVVVAHLSPEHESHLVQMLQPYTQMPVCQVTRTTALERNRVYVIPPNANLKSIDTHLRLTELESRRARRAPIDHFLRTLAQTHGDTAIGVILSGAGSDGALGIRQVKEHGGLTLAQDPQTAECANMPQNAIETGAVDVVLAIGDMPEQIAAYCATQPALLVPDSDEDLPTDEATILEKLLAELRQRAHQDFAVYRRAMVLRRLRRRMRLRHVTSLQGYFEVLRGDATEPISLCNDLLLNVTEFFREPVAYATIDRFLREALERKQGADDRIRIWSIGCSTGEEAYSIAMRARLSPCCRCLPANCRRRPCSGRARVSIRRRSQPRSRLSGSSASSRTRAAATMCGAICVTWSPLRHTISSRIRPTPISISSSVAACSAICALPSATAC